MTDGYGYEGFVDAALSAALAGAAALATDEIPRLPCADCAALDAQPDLGGEAAGQ